MTYVDKYTDPFANERVAIIADNLTVQGGGEQVEATLAEQFNAPVYTLQWNPERFSKEYVEMLGRRVVELPKQTMQGSKTFEFPIQEDKDGYDLEYSPGVEVYLADLENVDLTEISADKLIAASSEAAKIAYKTDKPYITYVNYPNKVEVDYFWEIFDTKKSFRKKLELARRRWKMVREGKKVANSCGHLMANSEYTMHAIHDTWDVPYDKISVVNPPVDVEAYSPGQGARPFGAEDYFLAPQRLEPYKNVHTIIQAAKRAQKHVILVGSGMLTGYARREAQYSKYVHAFGYVSEERLQELLRGAEAVVQGTLREDFGIVPVEAMASGTPCILPASGGFLETVGNGYEEEPPDTYETDRGILLGPDDYSVKGLAAAMQEFNYTDYAAPEKLAEHAQKYSVPRFVDEVAECLEEI